MSRPLSVSSITALKPVSKADALSKYKKEDNTYKVELIENLTDGEITFCDHSTFTDLGPFRAIKYKKLLDLQMEDKTYGWTVEMQLKVLKRKYKYTEVPVKYRNRIGVSKVSGTVKGAIFAGVKILSWIFKYSLKR